jgi:hypothetical protein
MPSTKRLSGLGCPPRTDPVIAERWTHWVGDHTPKGAKPVRENSWQLAGGSWQHTEDNRRENSWQQAAEKGRVGQKLADCSWQ